jgi:hypothetical protein
MRQTVTTATSAAGQVEVLAASWISDLYTVEGGNVRLKI